MNKLIVDLSLLPLVCGSAANATRKMEANVHAVKTVERARTPEPWTPPEDSNWGPLLLYHPAFLHALHSQTTSLCEKGVIGQRVRLLIGRSARGILLRQHPHGRGKGGSQKFRRMKWKMAETNEECEERVEERSNTQAHDTWMR